MKKLCNKWLGILLTLSLLLALFPMGSSAAGTLTAVTIQGVGVSGEPLTAVVSGDGVDASQVQYQWYYGPTAPPDKLNRTQPIAGATQKEWTVDLAACVEAAKTIPAPNNKYPFFSDWAVWVTATYEETTVTAGRGVAPARNTVAVPNARKESDSSYVFRMSDGKEFIILATGEDTCFALAKDGYGRRAYDSAKQYFSNETGKETNIGYWLNHEFLTDGNDSQKLPSEIISHLVEREWKTENLPNAATSEMISGITTTTARAKVALLSIEEFNRYMSVIGTDDSLDFRWWLRSSTAVDSAAAIKLSGNGVIDKFAMSGDGGIRPAFYLSKEFFANVKIDVFHTGERIKAFIREQYPDYNSLSSAGYSADELAALGYAVSAPTYTLSGTIEGGEYLAKAELSQNGSVVSRGAVQAGQITFDTLLTAGNYDLTVTAQEGYERKAVTLGGEELTFADNSVSIAVTADITDLYIKLGKDYGELTSVKIAGEPVIGAQLRAEWSPSDIPAEELTFTWGYGPVGFNDARVKEIASAKGKSIWTANYADLKAAKGEINDWPIWLRVSYKGKQVDSAGFEIAPAKRTVPIEGAVEKTPAKYTFQVAGSDKTFTLLNTEQDGTYFVITNDAYGQRKFNTTATSEYSPEKAGCVAQWLNDRAGGFPSEENTLPQGILDAIDWEHVWSTETIADKDVAFQQTAQGINLLSMNEYNTYYRKIGVHDFEGRWWLRSATNANQVLAMDPDKTGTTTRMTPTAEYLVRPVFYLDKDFFATCKLNVDTLGSEVRQILRARIDELQTLYTEEERKAITEGRARLTALALKDSLDQPMEMVQQGEVIARAEFVNTNQSEAKAVLMIALYNNDALVKMEQKTVQIAGDSTAENEGESTVDSISMTIDEVEPGYEVKAFVWRDCNTMIPMGQAAEIDAKGANLPFVLSRFSAETSFGTVNLHKSKL